MLIINSSNKKLVEELASVEMCCRIFRNVAIDLPAETIVGMIENNKISKETALVSTNLSKDVLGSIDNFTLLERYASLVNPLYAEEWYERRFEWTSLLYTQNEDPEILRRILPHLSKKILEKLELPVELYLSAGVKEIEVVSKSEVPNFSYVEEPTFTVCDPTLAFWRETLDKDTLRRLHQKSSWSLFDPVSDNCIFVNGSEEDTRIMLLANSKPLHVIISRGVWTTGNIEDIEGRIERSLNPRSMTFLLFERVCRLHGEESELAKHVKRKLRYNKILSSDNVLQYYTTEWRPSVPYIHSYIMAASRLELDRLIEANYNVGSGIFNALNITTPMALRRLSIACLQWLMINKPDDHKALLNVLNVITSVTYSVPWSGDDARVVDDAVNVTSTPEVKLQLILMKTYPVEYKERYV